MDQPDQAPDGSDALSGAGFLPPFLEAQVRHSPHYQRPQCEIMPFYTLMPPKLAVQSIGEQWQFAEIRMIWASASRLLQMAVELESEKTQNSAGDCSGADNDASGKRGRRTSRGELQHTSGSPAGAPYTG